MDQQAQYHFSALLSDGLACQAERFSPAYRENLRSGVRTWILFCLHFNRPYLQADRETLVAFIELLSHTSKGSHIWNVLVAFKHLHEATNNIFPETDYVIDGVLQGLKRQQQHTPRRRSPHHIGALEKDPALLRFESGSRSSTLVCHVGHVLWSVPEIKYVPAEYGKIQA